MTTVQTAERFLERLVARGARRAGESSVEIEDDAAARDAYFAAVRAGLDAVLHDGRLSVYDREVES